MGDLQNAQRIPFEQIGKVNVSNELMRYVLPATGGPGTTSYTAGGTVLLLGAAVLLMYKRSRRKEDRASP